MLSSSAAAPGDWLRVSGEPGGGTTTSRGGKSGSGGQKMMGSLSRGKVIFRRPDLKGISPKKYKKATKIKSHRKSRVTLQGCFNG